MISFKTLVIIPCGQAKIWKKKPNIGPVKAKNAYIGPPFKKNKKFAERFADKWIILSAKFGFIDPEFVIKENYDVSFSKKSSDQIGLKSLMEQFRTMTHLHTYDTVIALGGKNYTEKVEKVLANIAKVIVPTRGLRQGEAMQLLNSLMELDKIEMIKQIGKN